MALLNQWSANFFCKGPGRKYFRLCRQQMIYYFPSPSSPFLAYKLWPRGFSLPTPALMFWRRHVPWLAVLPSHGVGWPLALSLVPEVGNSKRVECNCRYTSLLLLTSWRKDKQERHTCVYVYITDYWMFMVPDTYGASLKFTTSLWGTHYYPNFIGENKAQRNEVISKPPSQEMVELGFKSRYVWP